MAKIDELQAIANKIAEILIGVEEMEINHNEHGTAVYFDNAVFNYDENGKSEG
ncbi:MAG: hypothetical protein QM500_14405 [Methylococcales bacterium]